MTSEDRQDSIGNYANWSQRVQLYTTVMKIEAGWWAKKKKKKEFLLIFLRRANIWWLSIGQGHMAIYVFLLVLKHLGVIAGE